MWNIDFSTLKPHLYFMVAEAPPQILSPVPKVANSLPLRVRMAAKTMYLVNGLTPKEIEAAGIGITAQQISNLANREGWVKKRREVGAKLERAIDAQTAKAVQEVQEAIATESEELVFGGLDLARSSLVKKDARGFAQAANGVRALSTVARECRAPAGELAGSGNGSTLNLFFVAPPPVQQASEPKNVQEVEAKKIAD